ncbi:hypothetical protein [Streptomyces corynorhini]|uniref:hypothetical protein n=1 Tax=Streptomyces corynorhini TaxID=2282652 RepID=UPI001F30183B|nr:hypothetical protein [Streptomyces corynorhini]
MSPPRHGQGVRLPGAGLVQQRGHLRHATGLKSRPPVGDTARRAVHGFEVAVQVVEGQELDGDPLGGARLGGRRLESQEGRGGGEDACGQGAA